MALSDIGSLLLTIGIFLGLFILGYVYITKRTLTDLIKEIKDLLTEKKEELIKK
jgi:hypothetical protein